MTLESEIEKAAKEYSLDSIDSCHRVDFKAGVAFAQANILHEPRVKELVEAAQLLLVETYCLMTQLKKPKRLDEMDKSNGSVAFAYHSTREALQKLEG